MTVIREVKKCVKQARYVQNDTGKKRLFVEVDKKGLQSQKEEPVYEKVLEPAKYEIVEVPHEVWIVQTQFYDGEVETHEFTSQEDAKRYYRGV
jgi:hypothetical protein